MGWMSETRLPLPLFDRNRVIAQVRLHAQEAGDLVLLVKMIELQIERKIAETVAVIGEEFFFALQVFLRGLQTHADVRVDTGVSKGDPPVVNVAVDQLEVFAAARQYEIIRGAFVIIQKVVLDGFGFVAQAKNEIPVADNERSTSSHAKARAAGR